MSILDALSPYKLLAEIVVIGSLAAGTAYGIHQFLEHERQIGRNEVRALWDAQTAKDERAARIETARLAKQAEDAEKNGANREQTIRTLATASGNANLGLRDTLATIRGGVPSATVDALGKSIATLSTVLAECSGRYQGLAEKADRHASDVKTLQEAWPKDAKK
jgi:uncharacterized protein (DUF2252 family)